MARIPDLDLSTLTGRQREVHQDMMAGPRGGAPGPLAVWLHRPELADRAQKLGQYCRYDSSLPPRLSELAILVTARIWDAGYEWQAHEPMARKAGVAPDIISALANDEQPHFTLDDESIVYQFTRELNLQRRVEDDTYAEAERLLGRNSVIDLVGVLGYYSLISMTINAFRIDAHPE